MGGYPSGFPLVLLQAKVVGHLYIVEINEKQLFPLVLLQAKVVGLWWKPVPDPKYFVSISSPSSEGGGFNR